MEPTRPATVPPSETTPADFARLVEMLENRLQVIADHEWRDRDPAGQLEALKEVSTRIEDWRRQHADTVDFHLRHFLENCSYDKALAMARKFVS